MSDNKIIRVKPLTYEAGWQDDFQALGVRVPQKIPESVYAPVNHSPMPFSVEVDIKAMEAVGRVVGVIPNALYKGHIYSWDEF